MAIVNAVGANPHPMPLGACGVPVKRWSALTLQQKRTYVVCNAHHARWAIRWAKSHSSQYRDYGRAVVSEHRRLLRKALRNYAAITAKLHPPFRYPWWWVPLGICETGVNPPDPAYGAPGHPGGDGYHGFINFAPSTWDTYKRYVPGASQYAYAYDAPEYVQYLVTMAMHNAGNPWSQSNPYCSAHIGLS
jgi:hypothetical protein